MVVLFGYAIPLAAAGLLLGGFGLVTLRLWQLLSDAIDDLFPADPEEAS